MMTLLNQYMLVQGLKLMGLDKIHLDEPSNHHFAKLDDWIDLENPRYRKYQDPANRWYHTVAPELGVCIISDLKECRTFWAYHASRDRYAPLNGDSVHQYLCFLLLLDHWIGRQSAERPPAEPNVPWRIENIEGLSPGAIDCFILGLNQVYEQYGDRHPIIHFRDLNASAIKMIKTAMLRWGGYSPQSPPVYWEQPINTGVPLDSETFHNDDRIGSPSHGWGKADAERTLAKLQELDPDWQLWTNPGGRWIYIVKSKEFDLAQVAPSICNDCTGD